MGTPFLRTRTQDGVVSRSVLAMVPPSTGKVQWRASCHCLLKKTELFAGFWESGIVSLMFSQGPNSFCLPCFPCALVGRLFVTGFGNQSAE